VTDPRVSAAEIPRPHPHSLGDLLNASKIGSLAGDGQVIEIRPGISLGPQSDPAPLGKRVILPFEEFPTVQLAGDLPAAHRDPQGMPLAVARYLRGVQLGRLALLNLVDAEDALERVVTGDVIVVFRRPTMRRAHARTSKTGSIFDPSSCGSKVRDTGTRH
jgi:hypothetical protein